MNMDREYQVEMSVTYLTPDEVVFELEIRNLMKERERSLSVNRRKLKNALREEADGLIRIFSYKRDPKIEVVVCRERLERVYDELNDSSLDRQMSKTALLHLYHRLKLFKRTFGVGSYANDATWLFSKVIQTYVSFFNENALYSPYSVTVQNTVPLEQQGAASLAAQTAEQSHDLINLEQPILTSLVAETVISAPTDTQPVSNPILTAAENDPQLNFHNLSISATSVSVPNVTPVITAPIVT